MTSPPGLLPRSVQRKGVVSILNSTSVPLGADGVFTGDAEDVSDYATVSAFVYTDVDSPGENFDIQFSVDGVNWDYSSPVRVQVGNATRHMHVVVAQFMRVVYTNGSTPQTEFRLQVICHRTRDRELTVTTNEVLKSSEDVTLFRLGSDYNIDLARSKYDHMSLIHKFGRNEDLGTTVEDVWTVGGTYIWPTVASTLEAISTSANDTAGGSGARTIIVQGLDANFDMIEESITMNGTTATTATTAAFLRVNRVFVDDAGTYHTGPVVGGSAGDIRVSRTADAQPQGEVLRTDASAIVWHYGQSQLGRYTIPAGKVGLLRRVITANATSKPADVVFYQRQSAGVVTAPVTAPRAFKHFPGLDGVEVHEYEAPLAIPEKTDIWAAARLLAGSSGQVTIDMEIILQDVI
jgi:hypothetical protein